jgi:hypothetical protein
MAYRRSRIVTSVPSGSGGTWMMERSRFIEHTEEEVSEFMDQTESLFRNPDPFVTTIPETSESSGTLENIRTDHLPCLRKVREHLRSELRKHEYFRYLLRGMPSCKHKSEDALVLALRVETGIERDQKLPVDSGVWRFLFVRNDERIEEEEEEENDLPTDPTTAAYGDNRTQLKSDPLVEFASSETSQEDKNSILEDLCVICIRVEEEEFRVIDWWIEFI